MSLLDLIFPPKCEVCKIISKEVLCQNCRQQIRFMKPQFGIAAMALYDGVLKRAIHQFKFKKKKKLAEPLGFLLAKYLRSLPDLNMKEIDLIVPVPLHYKRQRERGFNQSQLLAGVLQRYYGIPLVNGLERKRETKPQFSLPKEERKTNVADAFAVPSLANIYGKNILLVDDIYTTGSTIAECVRALKSSGAKKVEVLTLSRAML